MADYIQIHWTAGGIEEARRVCRFLVQERIVANAQIVPWIESIYMLDNEIETEQETKVVLKTTSNRFDQVREIIESNCRYEVPEITFVTIDGGNQNFFSWLKESTLEESLTH